MNELVFIQYAFYILTAFTLLKIFIMELEDVAIKIKGLKDKIKKLY